MVWRGRRDRERISVEILLVVVGGPCDFTLQPESLRRETSGFFNVLSAFGIA
jgi:hypothetical protein